MFCIEGIINLARRLCRQTNNTKYYGLLTYSSGGFTRLFGTGMDLFHLFLQHRIRIFYRGTGDYIDGTFQGCAERADDIDVHCNGNFRMPSGTISSDQGKALCGV